MVEGGEAEEAGEEVEVINNYHSTFVEVGEEAHPQVQAHKGTEAEGEVEVEAIEDAVVLIVD